jgi:hypothetical protein
MFLCLVWQHCRRPWSFTFSCARLKVVDPALFEWDVFEMTAPIQSSAKCEVRSVKDEGRRKCCHTKHKNISLSAYEYLYFPDTEVLFFFMNTKLSLHKPISAQQGKKFGVFWEYIVVHILTRSMRLAGRVESGGGGRTEIHTGFSEELGRTRNISNIVA